MPSTRNKPPLMCLLQFDFSPVLPICISKLTPIIPLTIDRRRRREREKSTSLSSTWRVGSQLSSTNPPRYIKRLVECNSYVFDCNIFRLLKPSSRFNTISIDTDCIYLVEQTKLWSPINNSYSLENSLH